MKIYAGTKIIHAEPSKATEQDKRGNYPIGADGFKVVYHDGYSSWSPKDVFDSAYYEVESMPIGIAIELMRSGKMVSRKDWLDMGMYLVINPGIGGITEPFIALCIGSGESKMLMPWSPGFGDMLATDWALFQQ